MRIVMPLFDFESSYSEVYAFESFSFRIEPLRKEDIFETNLFSVQDIYYMKQKSWCLVFENDALEKYIENSNLLLMVFRIAFQCKGPFIKYRLCKENINNCRKLNDPLCHNYASQNKKRIFSESDFKKIDVYFGRLMEMNLVSIRTKNTLYFTFRGMSSGKWIDAFMLYMAAIESLFSKDKPGGATEVIKTRVTSLLNPEIEISKDDIDDLYDLRSRMVHGRIEISDDPNENLKLLVSLENILIPCLRVYLERNLFKLYATKAKRDKFMGSLNHP